MLQAPVTMTTMMAGLYREKRKEENDEREREMRLMADTQQQQAGAHRCSCEAVFACSAKAQSNTWNSRSFGA